VPGILYAFDASNLSHELWDSRQNSRRDGVGMYAKFTPPTIANGKVYVPTFSKQLAVYGLTAGDFSLKADPDVLVAAGPSVSTTVQVIPQAGGLTTSVALSCPDLPAGTSCTFTPASLPPQSDTMKSTLTVMVGSVAARKSTPRGFWPATWLWLGLCAGVLPLGGWRKKHLCCLFAISGIVAILLAAAGCGGGSAPAPSSSSPASVLPASKITVLAVSGAIQHKSTVTLSGKQ
ncbi:MAG TPA: hypothetical protein VFK81_17780, partial [Terriglobales bacterium]|nr:hypothetical protein [Terriglobales bacterium]